MATDMMGFPPQVPFASAADINVAATSAMPVPHRAAVFSPNMNYPNVDIVLAVKGKGALVATYGDGSLVGGDPRGDNAVDLQASRTASGNVASGQNSVISGGYDNAATAGYSTVSGGQSNTAQTGTGTSIGGGFSNTAGNSYATVAGGQFNTASGSNSTVGGGSNNTANGQYSAVPGGAYAYTRNIMGAFAFAGYGRNLGKLQWGHYVLYNSATNTASPTLLTTDGSGSPNTLNMLLVPINSIYAFRGRVSARRTGTIEGATWEISGMAKCGATGTTVSIVAATVTVIAKDTNAASWDVTISASTSPGAIAINVVGDGNGNIAWIADIDTTENVN